jgi:hypothetical protein
LLLGWLANWLLSEGRLNWRGRKLGLLRRYRPQAHGPANHRRHR